MIERSELFIGGEWVPAHSTSVLEVRSPATGELVGTCPDGDDVDVDRAVAAARQAFDTTDWPWLPIAERAEVLARLGEALHRRGPELDELVPRESGIPALFHSGSSGTTLLDYYAELGRTYQVEEVRAGRPGASGPAVVRRGPVGVVAGIVPWNGPVMQILMKMTPALLAGCTIVIKTAPETPLSSFVVAEAVIEAGVPAGVVNIVPGGREAGVALVGHPGVDRVSFTGSTASGEHIATQAGTTLTRVNLELGGKSAAIVLDDADLDAVVPTMTQFGLFFNGEACSALTRVLAPRDRYDEIVERICAVVAQMPVGDPTDPGTFIGPLISERQRDIVEAHIATGVSEGAEIRYGGGRPTWSDEQVAAGFDAGWFVEPTVFANVDNAMRLAQEEIFGPVIAVIPYDGIDDAIAIANDSELGLAGAVFGTDEVAALDVARRLRTGHVGINCQGQDWMFPFGGFKKSGIGREMGIEGLELYCELQTFGFPEGSTPVLRPGG